MADVIVPSILFSLFAVISSVGAFLLASQYRGRTFGIVAALLTFFFFAALFLGLLLMMPEGSFSGR